MAGDPVDGGGQADGPAEIQDAFVSLRDEVVGEGEGAALVVVLDAHRRVVLAERRPSAQHEFGATGIQLMGSAGQF
ncbi:hypothetical protein ACGFYP_34350 [Streptomyces sp. NPDC048370]|uniref:hypothetical protein n=1 Tax=Streptomyces sp. NPDC048370 TaxID=3365540 RepID=UPI0037180E15